MEQFEDLLVRILLLAACISFVSFMMQPPVRPSIYPMQNTYLCNIHEVFNARSLHKFINHSLLSCSEKMYFSICAEVPLPSLSYIY